MHDTPPPATKLLTFGNDARVVLRGALLQHLGRVEQGPVEAQHDLADLKRLAGRLRHGGAFRSCTCLAQDTRAREGSVVSTVGARVAVARPAS